MLSFDIEDWFQVENLRAKVKREKWDDKELRVVKNTHKLLSILDRYSTKATFFVLGWVAEKVPQLVLEIHNGGHEIACHGHGHELIYNQTPDEFRKDIQRAKLFLERLIGEEIWGYRAPSFSVSEWAIDILKEEGFKYDSSLFPSLIHDRYGKLKSVKLNSQMGVEKVRDNFFEVSIPTLDITGKRIPWGGGGYFRILPYSLYRTGVRKILNTGKTFVFYLHAWEIDSLQPKVKNLKFRYRARHYIGLSKTECKLNKLLQDFKFKTIREGLKVLF